jgi:hypothetical protein
LAERKFVGALPEKVQAVVDEGAGGPSIGPAQYEQVVRIAGKVERLNDLDLENYLDGAGKTTDLSRLEAAIDRFLETKQAVPDRLGRLIELAGAGDETADSAAAALDKHTLFYLPLGERMRVIWQIANGSLVGDEDEQTLIRLLASTPRRDLSGLVEALKADRSALLKRLESVIDGEENRDYYKVLRDIVFGALDPADAHYRMQTATVLPWADPGLITSLTSPGASYLVEYTAQGAVHVVYASDIPGYPHGEYTLAPDEIVAVEFHLDEQLAAAAKGQTVFMPAANLLAFNNEQRNRSVIKGIDVGLVAAGGVGLIVKGTRAAKLLAALDFTFGAAGLVVNDYRPQIAKTEAGRQFLKVWDTLNTLIAIYGVARLVANPAVFRNVKEAWRKYRQDPGDIPPDQLRKLDQQTQALTDQADEALLANATGKPGLDPTSASKAHGRSLIDFDEAHDPVGAAARIEDNPSYPESLRTALTHHAKGSRPVGATKLTLGFASREAVHQKILDLLSLASRERPRDWGRVKEALNPRRYPEHAPILDQIDRVMDGLQDPKHYANVLAEAWELVHKGEAASINRALIVLAERRGLRVVKMKPRGIRSGDRFFKRYASRPFSFVDTTFSDEGHGAMTHVLQDLVLEELEPGLSYGFRELLGKARGRVHQYENAVTRERTRFATPDIWQSPRETSIATGDYVWRFTYDAVQGAFKGPMCLPDPFLIKPVLHVLLGFR